MAEAADREPPPRIRAVESDKRARPGPLARRSVALIEMAPPVLARALEPFPIPLRTLDALHVASLEFLPGHGLTIERASYDKPMPTAARVLRVPLFAL